jgi:Zn-dependent protease with chaperone function
MPKIESRSFGLQLNIIYFMFMSLGWDKRIIRSLYGAASRDSVFHIVTTSLAGQTRKCVLNLARVKNLSCYQKFWTGIEARPAPC